MSRSMLARIIEAFFKNPVLYIFPFVAFLAYGIVNAVSIDEEFGSSGTVFIDRSSLVADRTGVGGAGLNSFLTPAEFTSEELAGLLQTEVFLRSIIDDAGVELAPDPVLREFELTEIRDSISTFAISENILQITVKAKDPSTSQRLAKATIDRFIEFKVSLDVAESEAAETFFTDLVSVYQAQADQERDDLDAFLTALPPGTQVVINGDLDPLLEGLTPSQQSELNRLTAAEERADERLRGALDDLEASRLGTLQAETKVRQTLSIVDPPRVAQQPDSGLTSKVISIAAFSLVGLMIAVIGPIVAAALSQGIVFPEDLSDIAGSRLVAIVPHVPKRGLDLERATIPDAGAALATDTIAVGPARLRVEKPLEAVTSAGEPPGDQADEHHDRDTGPSPDQPAERPSRWARA